MGSLRPQLPFHEMPCSLFSWSHVRRMEGSVCSDRTEEERGQARSCPCSGEPARERRAGISGRDVADPSDKVQSTAKDVPQQLVSSINLAGKPANTRTTTRGACALHHCLLQLLQNCDYPTPTPADENEGECNRFCVLLLESLLAPSRWQVVVIAPSSSFAQSKPSLLQQQVHLMSGVEISNATCKWANAPKLSDPSTTPPPPSLQPSRLSHTPQPAYPCPDHTCTYIHHTTPHPTTTRSPPIAPVPPPPALTKLPTPLNSSSCSPIAQPSPPITPSPSVSLSLSHPFSPLMSERQLTPQQ